MSFVMYGKQGDKVFFFQGNILVAASFSPKLNSERNFSEKCFSSCREKSSHLAKKDKNVKNSFLWLLLKQSSKKLCTLLWGVT